MNTFNKILFALKESWTGLYTNFSKSFIQFLVCFVSLVFFSVVFAISYNVQDVAKDMKEKIEISVFIKNDATAEEILNIENIIKNNSNVKSYKYISPQEARKQGESVFADMPEMLEAIEDLDNPFPSSFNIELIDANLTEDTAKQLTSLPGVETDGVKFGEEYADKILSLSSGLIIVSYIALIFFFVTAVFFMISIINIIIAQKEEESKIMFMIGASPVQIRFPFYVQGSVIGLTSSSLAYVVFNFLYQELALHLPFVLSDLEDVQIILFLSILSTGFISGLLATSLALRKFNKTSKMVAKKLKN